MDRVGLYVYIYYIQYSAQVFSHFCIFVILMYRYELQYKQRENVWRSLWYLEMTILKDELTQKKGKISILYNVTPNWFETFDGPVLKGIGRLKNATPVKTAALHYCFSDPAFGAVVKFILSFADQKIRTRTKLHQGTYCFGFMFKKEMFLL